MKSLNYYRKEAGVTLVELMIGMAVGFIVIGGIITIYSNTAGSSASTIRGAVLNQEMNAIMQLVSNDLRRAGYWLDTNTTDTSDDNPFTDPNYGYNVTIGTWDSDPTAGVDTSPCITFAYDLNQNSKVGLGLGASGIDITGSRIFDDGSNKEDQTNMEIFGFRYNTTDGNLEMRTAGASGENFDCTDGTWDELNDPDVVTINSFSIDTSGSSCVDTSIDTTPSDWTTTGTNTTFCSDTTVANFTPGTTGTDDIVIAATDNIIEIRQVNITLTGELASDASVTKSLTRAIRVRNNRTITRPAITIPVP